MMKSLIIDTALQRCSAAVFHGGDVRESIQLPLEKGHAEHLAPMVKTVLGRAEITVKNLDRLGVIIGPGGFTGVRVGLAFARGLALGTRLAIVGITSLEALAITGAAHLAKAAMAEGPAFRIAPIIDARRGEVYTALYRIEAGVPVCEHAPVALSLGSAAGWIARLDQSLPLWTLGSGVGLVKEAIDIGNHRQVALAQCLDQDQIDVTTLGPGVMRAVLPATAPSPLYLRAPDAKPSARSLFEHLAHEQGSSS